ncbi:MULTISPECIES: hypothetical protein [Pseudomonas]|uniref:DUF2383 domain-containing protein n=1 Tax=Pseudomonas nitroreducens TaxID=46680 RepID=A0ABS0KTT0_PSENT|nr:MULTISPECIES: hypothetical protein [Pseudomonas]MBG6291521.1 hypothetical protein [Pseudomonas nitroreducens]MCJ1877903.1 hypothetical protein [Pseudomonas nitroreducens]MCJ1894300.1 hypothetical protein [Pseudomonas nitroreducens]NMZ58814.1 hypothetical protein [Pseudomonas nitroreducens]OBY60786.1 hypothetical protein A9513_022480 [Pseudomonas sp. AU12215]
MHRQASELQAAYLGEVRGENFFLGLAEQLPEGAASMLLLARLERQTGLRMARLLQRHGLPLGDTAHAAAQGRQRAADWLGLGWSQTLEKLEVLVAPYVQRYDSLAIEGDDDDRDILDELAEHERALLEFTRLARQGQISAAKATITRLLAVPA